MQLTYLGNNDEAQSEVQVIRDLGSVRTFSLRRIGVGSEYNGFTRASVVTDDAGTMSYTYLRDSGGKCAARENNDWRYCTVTDGRGITTRYGYSGSYLVRITEWGPVKTIT